MEEEKHIRRVALCAIDIETLVLIHNKGPIWDGDLPSKDARDRLLEENLIAKTIKEGEEGYQSCTYRGRYFLRSMLAELNEANL